VARAPVKSPPHTPSIDCDELGTTRNNLIAIQSTLDDQRTVYNTMQILGLKQEALEGDLIGQHQASSNPF